MDGYDELFHEIKNELADHAFPRATFDAIIDNLNRKANRGLGVLPQTRDEMKTRIISEFKASLG